MSRRRSVKKNDSSLFSLITQRYVIRLLAMVVVGFALLLCIYFMFSETKSSSEIYETNKLNDESKILNSIGDIASINTNDRSLNLPNTRHHQRQAQTAQTQTQTQTQTQEQQLRWRDHRHYVNNKESKNDNKNTKNKINNSENDNEHTFNLIKNKIIKYFVDQGMREDSLINDRNNNLIDFGKIDLNRLFNKISSFDSSNILTYIDSNSDNKNNNNISILEIFSNQFIEINTDLQYISNPYEIKMNISFSTDDTSTVLNDENIIVTPLTSEKEKGKEKEQQRANDKPERMILFGTETCQIENWKHVSVAGLYDSGTNLLYNMLKKNCKANGKKFVSVIWELPHTKHIPIDNITAFYESLIFWNVVASDKDLPSKPPWMFNNNDNDNDINGNESFVPYGIRRFLMDTNFYQGKYKTGSILNRELESKHIWGHKLEMSTFRQLSTLPVIIIKDPLTWIKSICRTSYTIHWNTKSYGKKICPKFVKDKSSMMWHYKEYKNILQLWNEFYSHYISYHLNVNILYPMIILRYEDLLFHPHLVTQQICNCVNGQFKNDDSFNVIDQRVSPKYSRNDRASALSVYGNPKYRYMGYTIDDIQFIRQNAHPLLVDLFDYKF